MPFVYIMWSDIVQPQYVVFLAKIIVPLVLTFAMWHDILAKMKAGGLAMNTTIDKFGRVVLPKAVRVDMQLDPGDILNIEERDEEIVLKPIRDKPSLVVKEGVLVYTGEAVGDVTKSVEAHRRERFGKVGLRKGNKR